jgi:hypothetical protein
MRQLLALLTILVGATLLAGTAAAGQPFHGKQVVDRTLDIPAGDLCDFDYHTEITIAQNIKIFFDDAGNRVGTEDQLQAWVLHRNDDTGFTLTERVHYTVHVDFVNGTFRVAGNGWHLRNDDGRIVLVAGGLYIVDIFTFELLKETPNAQSDFAGTICPALGGASALPPE